MRLLLLPVAFTIGTLGAIVSGVVLITDMIVDLTVGR
jgi:hypothetical protein